MHSMHRVSCALSGHGCRHGRLLSSVHSLNSHSRNSHSNRACVLQLPHEMPEAEAQDAILRQIDDFVHERFVLADQVLAAAAVSKIDDGDVIMTYANSSVVLNILLNALEVRASVAQAPLNAVHSIKRRSP